MQGKLLSRNPKVHLPSAQVIPNQEPTSWNYNTPTGTYSCRLMVERFIVGMESCLKKSLYKDEIRETTQERGENRALFTTQ